MDPAAMQRQHDLKIVYTPIHGSGITLVPRPATRFGFTNVQHRGGPGHARRQLPHRAIAQPGGKSRHAAGPRPGARPRTPTSCSPPTPTPTGVGVGVKNDKGEWVLLNGNQTAALLTILPADEPARRGRQTGRAGLHGLHHRNERHPRRHCRAATT
ncbi:MAG: hypothetical protein WKG07_15895 [Hymenobacter sp.]